MLRRLATLLPPSVANWLGALQFRYGWAAKAYPLLAGRIVRGEAVIARGAGKGLRIDATGRNVGYVTGTSEPAEQRWLVENLRADDVFYDVGANIGFLTLIAARIVGKGGAVVAFEPLALNVEQLRRNVALNGFTVEVVAAAVSAAEGVVTFGSAEGRRETARIGGGLLEVPAITIDGWLRPPFRPPGVIKIDVEGAEIDVLRGAAETIRAHRPRLLVEVHWLGRDFGAYADEFLRPLGYEYELLGGGVVPDEPVRCHVVLRAR